MPDLPRFETLALPVQFRFYIPVFSCPAAETCPSVQVLPCFLERAVEAETGFPRQFQIGKLDLLPRFGVVVPSFFPVVLL